jgi:hypothetical protein
VTFKDTSCFDEDETEDKDILHKDTLVESHLLNSSKIFKGKMPGRVSHDIFLSSQATSFVKSIAACDCSNILVVDDNAFNILALQFLIEQEFNIKNIDTVS